MKGSAWKRHEVIKAGNLGQVITEYRDAIARTRHKSADIEAFIDFISTTLYDYCEQFSDDTEFQYRIRKRFRRTELIKDKCVLASFAQHGPVFSEIWRLYEDTI